MAPSAWAFYNTFKEYMADGTLDLDLDVFYIALYLSSSNVETATLTAQSQVTNQVANANGYTTGGNSLSGVTWATGASASEKRFDASAAYWSATGGSISDVRYAVIYASTGELVCWSELSTALFSITDTNSLTVTPSANGIFELN